MPLFNRVQRSVKTRAERLVAEGRADAPTPLHELSFPDFCRLLSIRTKEGTLKSFAPENWHPDQTRFVQEMTGRDVDLKVRQVGFTTLVLALDLWFCIKGRYLPQVLIAVHNGVMADQLFVTMRLWVAQLKDTGRLPRTLHSNKREVVFYSGGAVRIIEAGNTQEIAEARGRGGTVQRLHLTELAYYQADTAIGALLACVPEAGEITIESTPNGPVGVFYGYCIAAMAGTNGYAFHFGGWLTHPEYRRAVPADFDPRPRDEHEQRARDLGADDEQIAWWRSKVDDPGVGLERALREYPIDPETAFAHRDVEAVVVPEFDTRIHVVLPDLPQHAHCYVGMDPGMQDKLGLVWGYWDFARQRLVIQRSYAERNVTTTPVADLLKKVEALLWNGQGRELRYWDGRQLKQNPYNRYSDVDTRFVSDLRLEHGISFTTTAKDDADAQLVAVRNAFLAQKIEIHPESGPLQEQLVGGRWNKRRKDWERSEQLGHLDCVDALIYLWRNVSKTLNPNPPPEYERDTVFVPAHLGSERKTNMVRAFDAVSGKGRWGRK